MELNLVNLKRYLRIDSFDNSHDVIILALKDSASGYVSAATGLSLNEIEDNDVAKQAVLMLVASWFSNKDGSPVRAGHIKAEFAVRAMLDQLFATQFAFAGGSGTPTDPDVPVDPNADKNLTLPATTFTSAAESKSIRIAHEDDKFYMLKQETKPSKMLRSQKLYDLSLTAFNERQDVSPVVETTNELQAFYETEEVESGVDYKVYTIEGEPHTVENLSGKYQKQGEKVFKVQSVSSSFGLNKLSLVEHEVVPPVEATYEEGRVLFIKEDTSEGFPEKAFAVSDKFLGSVDTGALVPKEEQTGEWLGANVILVGWFTATAQYSFVDANLSVSPFEDVSGKEQITLVREDDEGYPINPPEEKTTSIHKGLNAVGGWSLFSSKTVLSDAETSSVNGENVVGVKTTLVSKPADVSALNSFEFVPNFFAESTARQRFYLKPKSIIDPWVQGGQP